MATLRPLLTEGGPTRPNQHANQPNLWHHGNQLINTPQLRTWTSPSSRPCFGTSFDTDAKLMPRPNRQHTSGTNALCYFNITVMVLTLKQPDTSLTTFWKIHCLSNKTRQCQYLFWIHKCLCNDIDWHCMEQVWINHEHHTWYAYFERNIHKKVKVIGTDIARTENTLAKNEMWFGFNC